MISYEPSSFSISKTSSADSGVIDSNYIYLSSNSISLPMCSIMNSILSLSPIASTRVSSSYTTSCNVSSLLSPAPMKSWRFSYCKDSLSQSWCCNSPYGKSEVSASHLIEFSSVSSGSACKYYALTWFKAMIAKSAIVFLVILIQIFC